MEGSSGSQMPDTLNTLFAQLHQLFAMEKKFQPNLTLRDVVPDEEREVTIGMRNGSANVLRCLKVCYDLPSDVLIIAINLMDCFLTKMNVRPKHMSCISIACFHLGCRLSGLGENDIPDPSRMISMSQCKCTTSDMLRMENVIIAKLGIETPKLQNFGKQFVSPLSFLHLFSRMFALVKNSFAMNVQECDFNQLVEVVVCDGSCTNLRFSEIALALLLPKLDYAMVESSRVNLNHQLLSVITFMVQVQLGKDQGCEEDFFKNFKTVTNVIEEYKSRKVLRCRRQMDWPISMNKLRLQKPSKNLYITLPTITEDN